MRSGTGTRRNFMDWLRPVRRAIRGVEAAQVRHLGRSVLSTVFRTPVLVLETTGRKTERRRSTSLAYHQLDNGDLVVVGGAGGQVRTPDWVWNLRSHPSATVVIKRLRVPVEALELAGDERRIVRDTVSEVWPQIEVYERRAGRPVPIFILRAWQANQPEFGGIGTASATDSGASTSP